MDYYSGLYFLKQLLGFADNGDITLNLKLLTVNMDLLKLLESFTLFTSLLMGFFLFIVHPFSA